MGWLYLVLAIILEVFGTTLMKMSDGLTRLVPSVGMFAAYILCFAFLSLTLKTIDMSVAYAVWCALGIVCITAIGVYYFHEPINLIKVLSILFIVIGVVGLKLTSAH